MVTEQDSVRGWAVVVAAFFTHFFTHGIVYSYGILFVELEEVFNCTKSEIAWIISLTTGALYLSGPFAGYFVRRYGSRTVSIGGTVLSAFGCGLTILAPNLYFLYVSLGILSGVGYGLVFIPAVVEVTIHFKKQRALACGIALSGAGAGALASPLVEFLLETYAWRGTLVICSGVLLNCIPCSLIYRSKFSTEEEDISKQEEKFTYSEKDIDVTNCDGSCNQRSNLNNICMDKIIDTANSSPQQNTKIDINEDKYVSELAASDRLLSDDSDKFREAQNKNQTTTVKGSGRRKKSHVCSRIADSFLCTVIQRRDMVLFYSSQILFFTGFYFPYIGIPPFGLKLGITERNVALVISACGVASVVGRVILGFLSDRSFINSLTVYKLALLAAGISTAAVPLLRSFPGLVVYAVIFGSSTAVMLSQTTVVLAEIVGLEKISEAMGLNNMFSGIGALIGPPLLGLLYDITKTHTYPFVISGASMVLGGIFLFLMKVCSNSIMD